MFFLSAACRDATCLECNFNSPYVDNNGADGWDASMGDCNVLSPLNAFKVIVPTAAPSIAPTASPTISPTESASPSEFVPCDWGLNYFSSAATPQEACRFVAPEETVVVADGTCRFNSRVGYYRAFCSGVDGALTFTEAHCEEGCINCQPFEPDDRTTPATSFIRIRNEYLPGSCYLINDVVDGDITGVRHSWTVTGTCLRTCEIAPGEPTSAPTHAPTLAPTPAPTSGPTLQPTVPPAPTSTPTGTSNPTAIPSSSPTTGPTTLSPTNEPSILTAGPTVAPVTPPEDPPTMSPATSSPTALPVATTTETPTTSPVDTTTEIPTTSPVDTTTEIPTTSPVTALTPSPTASPIAPELNQPTFPPIPVATVEPTFDANEIETPALTPASSAVASSGRLCLVVSLVYAWLG